MTTTSKYLNRSTPNVYITEIDAFGTAIVGVATAVPIFIGYTQFAGDPVRGSALYGVPVAIGSMAEYASCFGGAAPGGGFLLQPQLALFYANGGDRCFVVSAGSYWEGQAPVTAPKPDGWTLQIIKASDLLTGLTSAGDAVGPTITVVPEACLLDPSGYSSVACAMLKQARLKDRIAILDLPGCMTATDYDALVACRQALWDAIGPAEAASFSYGAAYAPALVLYDGTILPPSAAIAGMMTKSDGASGVWNAPANIVLAQVQRPLVELNDSQQGDFNMPTNGQAIDLIRAQINRGAVVWGARTLDGNSNDYRYIPVRRTLIYVEQSIKLALQWFVFAPNDRTSWNTVTSAISGFLTRLWQSGGLMGAKSTDAFTVSCGLGSTMTAQDVLDGYMVVAVEVQLIHPGEFVELTFKQTMGS